MAVHRGYLSLTSPGKQTEESFNSFMGNPLAAHTHTQSQTFMSVYPCQKAALQPITWRQADPIIQ